ncbi:MAG: LuxR C-terminal-related transcriptional regulator, partial [Gaiellales bacterium]
ITSTIPEAGQTIDTASMTHALTWVLSELTSQGSMLLIVDDLQWTDAASQQVLALLAAKLEQMPVAVIAAVRDGDRGSRTDSITSLLQRADVGRIQPLPLSAAALERMVRDRLGVELPRVAQALHAATGGVPFLVTEQLTSIAAMSDRSEAELAQVVDLNASVGVAASVKNRLRSLGDAAEQTMYAVTVLGEHATSALVQEVAELDHDATAKAINDLEAAHLIDVSGQPIRPIHPLVTQAAHSLLSSSRLHELHRRCLVALQAAGADVPDLAAHALATNPSGDARTAHLLVDAGRRALDRGAPDIARQLLERALREPAEAALRAETLPIVAQAHLRAGDATLGVERWRDAIELSDSTDSRVELLIEMADALVLAGRFADSVQAFVEARDLLEPEHDPRSPLRRTLLARASTATAMLTSSWHEEIVKTAEVSLATDSTLDTHADRQLFIAVAYARAFEGTDAAATANLALRGLAGTEFVEQEGCDSNVLFAATGVLAWADRHEDDLRLLSTALEDARRRGSVLGHATAMFCRGGLWQRRGHISRAISDIESSVAAHDLGWTGYVGVAQALLVSLLISAERVEDARSQWERIDHQLWRDTRIRQYLLDAEGELLTAEGDLDGAVRQLVAAEQLRDASMPNPAMTDSWAHLAAAYRIAGRGNEAEAVLESVREPLERWGAPRGRARMRVELAQLTSSPAARCALLEHAVDLYRSYGAAADLSEALRLLGRYHRDAGNGDAARELLREAHAIAGQVGAIVQAKAAALELERLGDAVSATITAISKLTPGELRVAELAASGMTNRQIAEALFVTIKAIEWHLSHTYAKLGIKGRRELAGVLGIN